MVTAGPRHFTQQTWRRLIQPRNRPEEDMQPKQFQH